MARLAVDLSALFIARHVPVPYSRARVEADMTLAPYELTPSQEFYAGSHLSSIRLLESTGISGCSIDMRWEVVVEVEVLGQPVPVPVELSRRIG
jgi:hypothetical protein